MKKLAQLRKINVPRRVHPTLRFGDEAAGYKLPKDIAAELNDAAKVKTYDDMARPQMKALGIPEEMHGNLPGTFGEGKGAFSPHGISGGGNTHYLTQLYVPRINVDAAVLDSAHPVFTQLSPSWKTASLEARMQAVAAHEYAEAMMHSRGIAGAYPKEIAAAITKLRSGSPGPYLEKQLKELVTKYGYNGAVKAAPDLPGLSPEAKQILEEYRRMAGLE
ncbi:hypothetical protein [Tuwongella immobilis]|uniref:Uncharacterized protein n=1 Tax=Tuwongella immobilis TaxID=692036 RepID=A0A6C2YHB4_9BACT|nr:hypothetical protein [Tuwongella immobilis]VIP00807.1 unnamed protein product [Tuwongella immobilis]VTR97032.1 unnamed protein product [Tuwongella immobilis]